MKKYILLIILTAHVSLTRGNVAPPQAHISEIFIDNIDNWTVELGFYTGFISYIDSIRLVTSSGSSVLSSYSLIPGGGYGGNIIFDSLSVITNSNLVNPLSINPNGDFIKIISYALGNYVSDSVVFGNLPGSTLDCIHNGESIIFLTYIQSSGNTARFCIDKSPTIGIGNDTTGALSSFTGKVFDLNGNAFTEGFFPLPGGTNLNIFINPDGSFLERIFSGRYTFDTINIRYLPWPYTIETYTVEQVDFCLRPDSVHHQDIITTSLVTDIDKPETYFENAVVISPNPFKNKVTFYFNLENHQSSDDISLLIFGQGGRILDHMKLFSSQKKYEWIPKESILSGVLLFQLKKNNQLIKSGKLIKL